jgi:hypothetical protein
MEIKLFIEDKEKTFVVPFVKGRMFRRVIEIYKKYNLDDLDPETLDVLVDFIVECFNSQFSRDEFYDGIAADNLIDTILGFINKIAGVGKNGAAGPNLQKN